MTTAINCLTRRLSPAHVFSKGRRRNVIVELDPYKPGLVGFRLKGMRTTYYLLVEWCFREALRAELARVKAEKKRLRRTKHLK